jgi:hypothetical protein
MRKIVIALVTLCAIAGGLAACQTPNPDGTTTIVPQTDKLR